MNAGASGDVFPGRELPRLLRDTTRETTQTQSLLRDIDRLTAQMETRMAIVERRSARIEEQVAAIDTRGQVRDMLLAFSVVVSVLTAIFVASKLGYLPLALVSMIGVAALVSLVYLLLRLLWGEDGRVQPDP